MSLISPESVTGMSEHHIVEMEPNAKLHKDVVAPWHTLTQAAKQAGFDLQIASGFRSFERQAMIWNNKMSGTTPVLDTNEQAINLSQLNPIEQIEAIMLFSALPGGSRHHWGTDIDVFASNLLAEGERLSLEIKAYSHVGTQAPIATWLKENAHQFGFEFPYLSYNGGVAEEPWHLSYRPVANQFEQAINPTMIKDAIVDNELLNKEVVLSHLDTLYNRFIMSSFLTRN